MVSWLTAKGEHFCALPSACTVHPMSSAWMGGSASWTCISITRSSIWGRILINSYWRGKCCSDTWPNWLSISVGLVQLKSKEFDLSDDDWTFIKYVSLLSMVLRFDPQDWPNTFNSTNPCSQISSSVQSLVQKISKISVFVSLLLASASYRFHPSSDLFI